jgi:hypothetical protein
MNNARATLVCNYCGEPYDPNSDKWNVGETEDGVTYFEHYCTKYRVAFNYSDNLTYEQKKFADRIKDAICKAMA